MPVRADDYDQISVLTVEGDLSAENIQQLRDLALNNIEKRNLADFIVDLEKCEFADSAGLETLLWLRKQAEEAFGKIKLASVPENLKKILSITRLDTRFDTHPDLADALKFMR
jgi:anti-sigma B factor antagonist